MASEKQAARAERMLTARLRNLGAFAVDVRKAGRSGGFAVHAFFSKKPERVLPKVIVVKDHGTNVSVPLRVVIAERFEPE